MQREWRHELVVTAQVAKVYDMQGRCQKEMLKGVNIIVTTKENGEATTIKRINR